VRKHAKLLNASIISLYAAREVLAALGDALDKADPDRIVRDVDGGIWAIDMITSMLDSVRLPSRLDVAREGSKAAQRLTAKITPHKLKYPRRKKRKLVSWRAAPKTAAE
jgi:AmiR/NasT family two-component response regulator